MHWRILVLKGNWHYKSVLSLGKMQSYTILIYSGDKANTVQSITGTVHFQNQSYQSDAELFNQRLPPGIKMLL